jgi:formate-dependent nitrite reductase membrane component NrfD
MLDDAQGLRTLISVLGIIFAFGTMIYTGILLGAARPIAFWSTAMLPLLFLISALSTGIMAVLLFGSLAGAAEQTIVMLEKIDMPLIIMELIVLAFYLQGTHRVPESRESARIVLAGSLAPLFWFGVVIIGLLAPLVIDLFGVYSLQGVSAHSVTFLASICGLIGGLLLRKVVLAGGIHAPLVAGRFEYGLTNV